MAEQLIEFRDINEHGPQNRHVHLRLTPEEIDPESFASMGDIDLDVTAHKGDIEREYIVEGTIAFSADLQCSRCLDPLPFATQAGFTVRYRPYPSVVQEDEEIEVSDEELDVEFYSEPVASLKELAAEQIQLSVPMKPLCDDRCQGLCPECGTNRNREACDCAEKVTDERWQALSGIRDELRKKKKQ
jgi:uncharacterized protein